MNIPVKFMGNLYLAIKIERNSNHRIVLKKYADTRDKRESYSIISNLQYLQENLQKLVVLGYGTL